MDKPSQEKYAIIQTGGKQYRVEKGDIIQVELLKTDSKTVEFKEVLLVNDGQLTMLGTPHVTQCLVKGDVLKETKGPKVVCFKYKRRKSYRRKVGHRQKYTEVQITDIETKKEGEENGS